MQVILNDKRDFLDMIIIKDLEIEMVIQHDTGGPIQTICIFKRSESFPAVVRERRNDGKIIAWEWFYALCRSYE